APAKACFESMPQRVIGERDERLTMAERAISYYHPFLDDALRAILPHDLVLLGAPTGEGKTDLALSIAASNAKAGRRVCYFALEAEPRELERRQKFSLLAKEVLRNKHPGARELNYTDWILGRCEHICGPFNADADKTILQTLSEFRTFYRGARFTQGDLGQEINAIHQTADLIVIDHLHYVDSDDPNELRALAETVKTIRDLSLRIGKPIILIAHLRKRDVRSIQGTATIDDFHGSSNIVKIATQAITIERARKIECTNWYLAPTFVSILKDRRGGAPGLVALSMFDRRFRSYQPTYTLGRVGDGGKWEPLDGDVPTWAKHHRAVEGAP
ncbi:MAG: AAA family ATPase, partial [Proteobacteria bacterium]|nr:AAA family ATPase [Pseudomonadota bacterium]